MEITQYIMIEDVLFAQLLKCSSNKLHVIQTNSGKFQVNIKKIQMNLKCIK